MLFGAPQSLPIDCMYGTKITRPSPSPSDYVFALKRNLQDAHALVRDTMEVEQDRQKTYYDKGVYGPIYQVGDKVLVFNPTVKVGNTKKFTSFYHGPCTIIEVINDVNFRLREDATGKNMRIHYDRLKKYKERKSKTERETTATDKVTPKTAVPEGPEVRQKRGLGAKSRPKEATQPQAEEPQTEESEVEIDVIWPNRTPTTEQPSREEEQRHHLAQEETKMENQGGMKMEAVDTPVDRSEAGPSTRGTPTRNSHPPGTTAGAEEESPESSDRSRRTRRPPQRWGEVLLFNDYDDDDLLDAVCASGI